MIVDVNRNGSSIFTTRANRPKLNIGAMASGVVTPDVRSGIAGDRLTFDVDQVDVAPAAAADFIAVETSVPGAGITSLDVARPAASQLNDVVCIGIWSQSATDAMWTPPVGEGWVSCGASFSFNGSRVHWFRRVDDNDTGPWAFAAASSHTVNLLVKYVFRGADLVTPIDVYAVDGNNTPGTAVTVPAMTTTKRTSSSCCTCGRAPARRPRDCQAATTKIFSWDTTFNRHAAYIALGAAGVQASYGLTLSTSAGYQATRMGIRPADPAAFTQLAGLAVAVRYLEVTA